MKRLVTLLLFCLLWSPWKLQATPTEALTVDDQQMLVPDDFDATQYYHLAPNFNNHVYFEVLDDSSTRGWAFLDLHFATLIVWWNNALHDQALYDGLGQSYAHANGVTPTTVGYTEANLPGSPASPPQTPEESLIGVPDVKVSVGLGSQVSQWLALGICVQYAENTEGNDEGVGSNQVVDAMNPNSQALYLSNSSFYNDLSVTSFSNKQFSSQLSFAPSLGLSGSDFSLDLKGEMIFNSVQNVYSESDFDNSGDHGNITQELQSNGPPSWDAMGRLRIPVGDGSVVLRGSVQDWNLDLQHSVTGTFNGPGFTAAQLAGYNQDDASETYTLMGWDSMLGWVENFKHVNGLLVVGLGANGNAITQNYTDLAPQSANDMNSLYTQLTNDYSDSSWAAPFLLGGEIELTKWMRVSGSAIRNVAGNSNVAASYDTFNSNGSQANSYSYNTVNDLVGDWNLNLGFGLHYNGLVWDVALNTDFLGSEDGFSNPIYSSTLAWGY